MKTQTIRKIIDNLPYFNIALGIIYVIYAASFNSLFYVVSFFLVSFVNIMIMISNEVDGNAGYGSDK